MRLRFGQGRQAKILVMDSDHTTAATLGAILKRQGYAVATAFNGDEAVAKAPQFGPDLLLSDVSLETLMGIREAVEITALLPECKVLFVSRRATISEISNAAPAGLVYSFTPKPLHPLDLLNAIAYTLSAESISDEPSAAAVEGDDKPQQLNGRMLTTSESAAMKARADERLHPAPRATQSIAFRFNARVHQL